MKQIILTYTLAYGGAFLSLIDPFIGLLIYVGFSIVTPEAIWEWAVPPGNYSRVIAIGLLIGWTIKGFGNWSLGRAWPTVIALLAFCAWHTLASAFSLRPDLAWPSTENLYKIVLPFVVGITLIDSLDKLKILAWVIVLSNGYLAYEFNLVYYTWPMFYAPDWHYRGFDNNGIAISMVTTFGPAFFLGLFAERWWQKLLAFTSAALMAHVVMFSMSRGGFLALIATGVVIFILIPRTWKHYLAFALALALAIRLAGPQVLQRFGSAFEHGENLDGSAAGRIEQWYACINAIKVNPFMGVGSRGWMYVAQDYGATIAREAHSTWLQAGAELGIPGLLFLITFYFITMVRVFPMVLARRTVSDPWLYYLSGMVISALVGFVTSAQFVSIEAMELPYYITLIGAGVLKLTSVVHNPLPASGPPGYVSSWHKSPEYAIRGS